jgi:hypothetical protein
VLPINITLLPAAVAVAVTGFKHLGLTPVPPLRVEGSNMTTSDAVTISSLATPSEALAFRVINEEWISTLFALTTKIAECTTTRSHRSSPLEATFWHGRLVLVRDWSPPMDGIQATIWATRTTADLHHGRPPRTMAPADASARVAEIAI